MTKPKAEIYPVYLLYGPEDYLIEEEIRELLNRTLSQKERGLNLHVFSGEKNSGQEIVQAAQTVPMFSRYRFVLVSEADEMDEEKIGALLKYFENPSPATCLVMSAQTLGLWRKHREEIERTGRVVEYPRLKGKTLVTWIKSRMGERGKSLSDEAAEYFMEVTGDHLHDLENVLEKVFLSVGDKKAIGLSDVEGIASDVKISTIFDLTDAIGHQNLEKALGILEKAMESRSVSFKKEEGSSKIGDPVPLLLSMMARQYRMIWRVKEFISQKRGAGEAAKGLGMSPWMVKNLIEQGKSFSESSLREGILKCHQTDLAIKRSRGPKDLLMEKLVIDLCRPNNSSSPFFRKVGTTRDRGG